MDGETDFLLRKVELFLEAIFVSKALFIVFQGHFWNFDRRYKLGKIITKYLTDANEMNRKKNTFKADENLSENVLPKNFSREMLIL